MKKRFHLPAIACYAVPARRREVLTYLPNTGATRKDIMQEVNGGGSIHHAGIGYLRERALHRNGDAPHLPSFTLFRQRLSNRRLRNHTQSSTPSKPVSVPSLTQKSAPTKSTICQRHYCSLLLTLSTLLVVTQLAPEISFRLSSSPPPQIPAKKLLACPKCRCHRNLRSGLSPLPTWNFLPQQRLLSPREFHWARRIPFPRLWHMTMDKVLV